jgi:hypothetical protein
MRYVSRHGDCRAMHGRLLRWAYSRLPITTLVRTEQRISVSVQGYLPPHNFTVLPLQSQILQVKDFYQRLRASEFSAIASPSLFVFIIVFSCRFYLLKVFC